MRHQVVFIEDAERDLDDLFRHILDRDGPEVAAAILAKIEQSCASLEDFPERGNVPKELISLGITEYRELHHKPWRMIYRILDNQVIVYCVADGRRDMQSFLERRLLR